MSGNSFGKIFKITTFGESHGKGIGVIVDGCPAGLELDREYIQTKLNKRRPGQNNLVTARDEKDQVTILSGIFEGKTLGTPIGMIIFNEDVKSKDYDNIKNLFRPGHADYTYYKKYGVRDHRGGGRSSARETAMRVAGGAVASKFLDSQGIQIFAYLISVGKIKAEKRDLSFVESNRLSCPDPDMLEQMEQSIIDHKNEGDSIGGIVEVTLKGVPAGLGEPIFDKLSSDLAKAMLSINAVKGFEIGDGFACTESKGSENNDVISKDGFLTNHSGGILGGISNGDDIVFRIAVKPTSSISKRQNTVDISGKETQINIQGRHDPCVALRAVPVVEAMTALTIADHLLALRCSRL